MWTYFKNIYIDQYGWKMILKQNDKLKAEEVGYKSYTSNGTIIIL